MGMMSVILILAIIGLTLFIMHLFRSWGRAEKEHKKEIRVKEREEKILEEMFRHDEARQQMAAAYQSHMVLRKEKQYQRELMTQPHVIEQSIGVLDIVKPDEVEISSQMFQAQAPPPPGIESEDLDMIAGFVDSVDSASDLETLAEDSEDIGQIEEKRSSKRRGKNRYIRFTSDGQTIDGMQDSDNLSEDEQERRLSMEVLHWASNEFKTVFERPPEHLTELLEFLDTGREQTEQAQGGESP